MYIAIRKLYGPAAPFFPDGPYYGLGFIKYNFLRARTYFYNLSAYSLIPLLLLFAYKKLTASEKRVLMVLPAWLLVFLCFAFCSESRLFLAPYALVVLPAIGKL